MVCGLGFRDLGFFGCGVQGFRVQVLGVGVLACKPAAKGSGVLGV